MAVDRLAELQKKASQLSSETFEPPPPDLAEKKAEKGKKKGKKEKKGKKGKTDVQPPVQPPVQPSPLPKDPLHLDEFLKQVRQDDLDFLLYYRSKN